MSDERYQQRQQKVK
ncbi:TPA: hypothetical protein LC349_003991, partial [Salmonella enterica subsp. enterica serovar Agbeni]|nr:hypothetical protein [Salmonella enterica subsp. enterica serovar Agbeni]